MTGADLTAWRGVMGKTAGKPISKRRAAALLGLSVTTYNRYEAGEAPVPAYIPLACAALAYGLPPWRAL